MNSFRSSAPCNRVSFPMLADRWQVSPSSMNGQRRAWRIFWATLTTSPGSEKSSMSATNSSPPKRAMVSLSLRQILLGLLAGHELADLAADDAHHLQERRIGVADFAAEELQHGEGDVARQHRKREGAVQPGPGGEWCPLETF